MTQQMRGMRWDESEDQKATLQISVVSLTHRQPLMIDILMLRRPVEGED